MYYYDIICESSLFISSFSMCYYIGFAIGAVVFPSLSDRYGRKKIYLPALTVNLFCLIGMLVMPYHKIGSLYFCMVIQLFIGLSTGARVPTQFCYFCELTPKKYHAYLSSVWNISEGIVLIYITIYYAYINKDWWYTVAFAALGNIVTLILLFVFVPESPKFLYDKKRFRECQRSLSYMAKVNGRQLKSAAVLLMNDRTATNHFHLQTHSLREPEKIASLDNQPTSPGI